MKQIVLLLGLLVSVQTVLPQGTIVFANRCGITTTAAPGQVYAPIYREDPADPTHRISGNTAAGIPAGSTSSNGASFVASGQGPTFTATLWAINAPVTGYAA